jgi:hypothetical protein
MFRSKNHAQAAPKVSFSFCLKPNALSYDDLVAMVIKSDNKLRMDRSKLRDLEVQNVSLQNSFEDLKTTHENQKISQEK